MALARLPKPQIEGIQTVTPTKVTVPRQRRQVSVADPVSAGIFRRCVNIVLYYRKEQDSRDSGWLVAGWTKESLGRALQQQPMISGRLQRREQDGDDGGLEIVSNDCGIRLVEARSQMNISEFLDLKERDEAEAELVFWKDIDAQIPQFSPLFYVQVTNFQCGGYSIGVSCSILLADILLRANFLETWANIHQSIVMRDNEDSRMPIFYLPSLKKTNSVPTSSIITSSSGSTKNRGQTVMFKVAYADRSVSLEGDEFCKKLALRCLEEADKKLENETSGEISLFVKENFEAVKVESCRKHEVLLKSSTQLTLGRQHLGYATWDDFGANEVHFSEGNNKPAKVSYWVGWISGGVIMAFPAPDDGDADRVNVNVIVTVP